MGKRLRTFWEKHHEAIITGAVTFAVTATTGGIAMAYNNKKNSVQNFSIAVLENDGGGETLLEMTYGDGRVKYLPIPVPNEIIRSAVQAAPEA